MDNELVKSFDNAIISATNIIIFVHISPDVDAIGSISAFANFYLNHYKKISDAEIHFIIPDKVPEFLLWLINTDYFISLKGDYYKCKEIMKKADLVICMDMNQPMRIGNYYEFFKKSNAKKINIDHHPLKSDDFDIVIRDCNVSSCSEVLYSLFSNIDKDAIDINVANAIYSGILGDTGSFSYSCNNVNTYYVVAELIKKGVDVRKVHDLVFNNYPLERTLLLGYILNQKLEFINIDNHIVSYYYLTEIELNEHGYKEGYLEEVINYALNIRGIVIAASFIQRNNLIRISFRSKPNYIVNEFAEKYFGGGGHPNASGATVNDKTLEECVSIYKQRIIECITDK